MDRSVAEIDEELTELREEKETIQERLRELVRERDAAVLREARPASPDATEVKLGP